MIHILSRLETLFPFIGQRPANENDFYAACDAAGIDVVFSNNVSEGLCVLFDGKDYIFLNNKLHGWRLLYVAFHELAHCLFHFPTRSNFAVEWFSARSKHKNHAEAEAVAAMLLLPLEDIENILASGLHEINKELAELVATRLKVYSLYKL